MIFCLTLTARHLPAVGAAGDEGRYTYLQLTALCRLPVCPQDNGELVAVTLLGMVARFCSGAAPHFPMKKVLLLVWKVLLVTLGGSAELRRLRAERRADAHLPPVPEDTAERTRHMRCSSPPLSSVDIADGQPRGQAMRLLRRVSEPTVHAPRPAGVPPASGGTLGPAPSVDGDALTAGRREGCQAAWWCCRLGNVSPAVL